MKLYYRDPKTGEYKEEREAQLDRHGQPITDVLFAVPDAPGATREGFARYGCRPVRRGNTLRKPSRCQLRAREEAGTILKTTAGTSINRASKREVRNTGCLRRAIPGCPLPGLWRSWGRCRMGPSRPARKSPPK